MSAYKENEDLINVGAYVKGTNVNVDKALVINEKILEMLKQEQGMAEHHSIEALYDQMVDLAKTAERAVNPEAFDDEAS